MHEVAEQIDAIETDFGDDSRDRSCHHDRRGHPDPDGSVGLRVRAGQYPWVALGMLRVRGEGAGKRDQGPRRES